VPQLFLIFGLVYCLGFSILYLGVSFTDVVFECRVGACTRPGYSGVAITGLEAIVPGLLGIALVMGRRGDHVSLMPWRVP